MCQIGIQTSNFYEQIYFEVIVGPNNDPRAIGSVERLIKTNKCRLGCIKEAAKSKLNLQSSMNAKKTNLE